MTKEPTIVEPISVKVAVAVRMTGISRSRIYELMKSGEIQYAKVGSSTLIFVESLKRLVESRALRSGAVVQG